MIHHIEWKRPRNTADINWVTRGIRERHCLDRAGGVDDHVAKLEAGRRYQLRQTASGKQRASATASVDIKYTRLPGRIRGSDGNVDRTRIAGSQRGRAVVGLRKGSKRDDDVADGNRIRARVGVGQSLCRAGGSHSLVRKDEKFRR